MKKKVRYHCSQEFEVPFDFNLRDVTGQTLLYMACCVGNLKIVEVDNIYQLFGVRLGALTSP